MLRTQTVKAAEIKANGRLLAPNDTEIRDLVHDIGHNGLITPLLVDEDMNLIDGFRRLTAMLALDREEVAVVVSDSYEDSLSYLRARVVGDPFHKGFDGRRIWELHKALTRQREEFTEKSRGQRPDSKNRAKTLSDILPELPERKNKTRAALSYITQRSEHWIQSALFFYSRAEGLVPVEEKWQPLIQELVEKMDAGLNPYTATSEWNRAHGLVRTTTTKSQQLLVLNSATHSMSGIVQSLAEIGVVHDGITKEQAAKYAAELRKIRTALFQTIRKLEERTQR